MQNKEVSAKANYNFHKTWGRVQVPGHGHVSHTLKMQIFSTPGHILDKPSL